MRPWDRGGSDLPRVVAWALAALTIGCEAQVGAVPEGALARVGDVVIEAERLEGAHVQLGAFGQARFRGPHGQRVLLDAVIDEELLVQEARDAGYEDDPLVEWAVLEELAELQRTAMFERRLPRTEVEEDVEALRARYARDPERYIEPERRRMRAVYCDSFEDAELGIAKLVAGETDIEGLAAGLGRDVMSSPAMKRNDADFPGYHARLFDEALKVGDPVSKPMLSGKLVLVGVLAEIVPARAPEFDEPELREQLVSAERSERLEAVEAQMLEELRGRYVGE